MDSFPKNNSEEPAKNPAKERVVKEISEKFVLPKKVRIKNPLAKKRPGSSDE